MSGCLGDPFPENGMNSVRINTDRWMTSFVAHADSL